MGKLLNTFIVLIVTVLIVTGCATPQSVPDAQASFCTALTTFETAVAKLGTITIDTPSSDVQSIQKEITKAWDGVKTAAQALPDAKLDSLTAAIEGLQAAIKAIPSSGSIGEAQASISAAVQDLETTIQETKTTLSCK
jgi:hypothetical protein